MSFILYMCNITVQELRRLLESSNNIKHRRFNSLAKKTVLSFDSYSIIKKKASLFNYLVLAGLTI